MFTFTNINHLLPYTDIERGIRRPQITTELIDLLKENEDISFKINN